MFEIVERKIENKFFFEVFRKTAVTQTCNLVDFVLQSLDAQLLIFVLKLFGFSAETVASSNEFHGSTTR